MATLVMFWDEITPLGDPVAGIRIENSPNNIEIPSNACGFRLGNENEPWYGAWYFAVPNVPGKVLKHFGITYSSAFAGIPSPSSIEARGPVQGCAGGSGTYVFVTPMGQFGITGDDPIINGAGSFRADFTSEQEIKWLDAAGEAIEVEIPEPDAEPPELPPEFFEDPPDVKGCFRDFEDELHCPEDADTAGQSAEAQALPQTGGLALFIAQNNYLIPNVTIAGEVPARSDTVPSGIPVELHCPAELRLTATFFKAPGIEPATVRYRFRFAGGPISTTFSVFVDKDGENSFAHTVPIPLPKPPGHGTGGVVEPGADAFSVFRPPVDPIGPGPSPVANVDDFKVEDLPDNEHKGSVRVEVLNAQEGIIASSWATYHLVCIPGSGRPRLAPGLLGAGVTSLQATVNRWLRVKQMKPLVLDGRFGPKTEMAVRAFQEDQSLLVDGIVGPMTWHKLLENSERDGCKKHRTDAQG